MIKIGTSKKKEKIQFIFMCVCVCVCNILYTIYDEREKKIEFI